MYIDKKSENKDITIKKQETNLKNIKLFFKIDLKIKELLINLKNKSIYMSDEENKINYGNDMYKSTEFIEESVEFLIKNFNINFNNYHEYFCKIREEIICSNYEIDTLNNIYNKYFSNMSTELVNLVRENIYGYGIDYYENQKLIFNKVTSINEILHAIHSIIISDISNYRSLPVVKEKQNILGYSIKLYGEVSSESIHIFESIPYELDTGAFDMISLDGVIIIMIRDFGHATTIQIFKDENQYKIDYFIPKVCNVEKVNKIKGVNKVKGDDPLLSTTGLFYSSKDLLTGDILDFIKSIPTDMDIKITDFKLY